MPTEKDPNSAADEPTELASEDEPVRAEGDRDVAKAVAPVAPDEAAVGTDREAPIDADAEAGRDADSPLPAKAKPDADAKASSETSKTPKRASSTRPLRSDKKDEENVVPLAIGAVAIAVAAVAALWWWNNRDVQPEAEITTQEIGDDAAERARMQRDQQQGNPPIGAPEPSRPNAIAAPSDVAAPPADAARTASGLASKVLEPGTGTEHPAESDRVTVHYTGWTTDGEMFDSSVARGEPASFPLNGVIAGWTEGVQLMVEGEKRRFWIPQDLAYGGRPGAPAGMLVFDVELIGFEDTPEPPPAPRDAEASQERTRQLARRAQIREEAASSYAEYVASHTAESEIRDAVASLDSGSIPLPPALQYHLVANPGLVWTTILTHQPDGRRDAFFNAVSMMYAPPPIAKIPDEGTEVIRAHVGRAADVDRFVSGLTDARFRPEVERLATTASDPQVRERAQRTLTKLEQVGTLAELRNSASNMHEFLRVGHDLLFNSEDPRQLAGVLIEVLANPASNEEVKRMCVQWLEGITRRAFGHDAEAWQRFWEDHRNESFRGWLMAAARQDVPLLRADALEALGQLDASEEGTQTLVSNLTHTHSPVRLAAAQSLLRWGDRRGIEPLLNMLESTLSTPRQQAFQALSLAADTTLGYDPLAAEEDRVAAVARWRRWAETNGPDPGD